MTTLHIIKLSENAPAVAHGFRYNVQIWTKDSGRGWCYAGNGKFLKTAGEVLSYGKEHADFYSADMYKDFYACMSEEDVVYFVGVYPARLRGYGYSVQIFVDGEYSDICKLCRTLADAENYAKEF